MKSARTLRWLMQQGGGGYSPLSIPNLLFFNSYKTVTPTDGIVNALGTKTITGTAPAMTISLAGSGVTAAHPGSTAAVSGYGNAGNNGAFTITNATTSAITIDNPAGVPEVGPVGARVDILGLCSSATDLVAGRVFTQATLNNKWAVNNNLIPGKNVLCTGFATQMARFMSVVDAALAGALDGVQPFTMFLYVYPVAFNVQVSFTAWITFEDAGAVSRVAARVGGNNTHRPTTANAAGVVTDLGIAHAVLPTNVWQLWALTHDGTTARFYLDGVLSGSLANVSQIRSALTRVVLSNRSVATTGLVGTRHYRAVEGAVARVMSAAELLDLRAFCQAEYA